MTALGGALSGFEPGGHLSAPLERRVRRLASSQRYRRMLASCRDAGTDDEELRLLAGLLLAEIAARPVDARAVEWLAAGICRRVPVRRVKAFGESATVGPFQLQGGRWGNDASLALAHLRTTPSADLDETCTVWNGAPSKTYLLVAQFGYHSKAARQVPRGA